jgi:hypothetical protein
MVVAVLVLLSLFVFRSLEISDTRLHVGDLRHRTEWLRTNTSPETTVMTEYPQIDFLYGGRRTVPYVDLPTIEALAEYMVGNRIDYLLVAPEHRWQPRLEPVYSERSERLLELLERNVTGGPLRLVHSKDRVRWFGLRPAASREAAPPAARPPTPASGGRSPAPLEHL